MNQKDTNIQKAFEALEPLNLSNEQLKIAEDYIMGVAGEDTLDKLGYKNLLLIKGTDTAMVMNELNSARKYDEARRLFNVLFAIGQSTCYKMVWSVIFNNKPYFTPETQYKYLAVFANSNTAQAYTVFAGNIKVLEERDFELSDFRKAIDCQRDTDEGKMQLLAIYFKRKYTNSIIENPDTIIEYSTKNNARMQIENDDLPLLEEYENLVINSFVNIVGNKQMPPSDLDKIKEDMRIENVSEMLSKACPPVRKNSGYKNIPISEFTGIITYAYLNFPISTALRNILSLCFALYTESTLERLYDITNRDYDKPLSNSIMKIGGDFDRIFAIDSREYIIWAARASAEKYNAAKIGNNILPRQLQTNRDIYADIIKNGIDQSNRGISTINVMIEAARDNAPDLYEEIIAQRTEGGTNKDMIDIANRFVSTACHNSSEEEKAIILNYLLGKTTLDEVYPFADTLFVENNLWGNDHNLVESYRKTYGDGEFPRRCSVLSLFKGAGAYLREEVIGGKYTEVKAEKYIKLFADFEKEKLSVKYQLLAFEILYGWFSCMFGTFPYIEEIINNTSIRIFSVYLEKRREETLKAFHSAGNSGRLLGLKILNTNPEQNRQEILSFTKDSAKPVKEQLLDILYAQKDWEEDIKKLLSSKKAGEREIGVRVLIKWQGEDAGTSAGLDYSGLFADMIRTEDNAKVTALLLVSVKIASGSTADSLTRDELVEYLHKSVKSNIFDWAYEPPFSAVHKTNGETASEKYLQALLLCYSLAEKNGINTSAASLAEELNADELAVYSNELFDKWLAQGAEAKKRWVLYAASIHGGAQIVQKLQHQIQEWAQNSRGAIAADAVSALALNPTPQALLIVDGIARKFKFKQVKTAAGKALEFAASQLNITKEELADRIVPNLGFDENMERVFDYGGRKFKVTITTALEIEVFDESGKKLKNLPAVGKKDDPEKAAAAYEEFKQMKKQMKTTVSSQQSRLEYALSVKRDWSIDAWKALFVKNPIMHRFAIGLIWGIYEDGKLTQSFRYMEDGSFNTENEEEFTLPESEQPGRTRIERICIGRVRIGLVHPTELTDVSLSSWRQQLEDYEIRQPIDQLNRPVYVLTDEEKEQKSLERFGGCILSDLVLSGKLLGKGWYRGSVQDGGYFDTYYREDAEAGLGVELHFSGSVVGGYNDGKDVTVYEARFYKAGTIKRGSYCYDEADDNKSIPLKDIPPRYFSEIVMQLAAATASSTEKDENWRER